MSISVSSAQIGDRIIFAGDWEDLGAGAIAVGYAGTLAGLWNGWGVPAFGIEVIEAIIADRDAERARLRTALREEGVAEDAGELDLLVDAEYCRLYLDGWDLIWDARVLTADHTMTERITVDADGNYNLAPLGWTWTRVTAERCLRVVGTI